MRDGLSLTNLGGDFTALGNEAATSTGRGRSYGAELFLQQKLTHKVFAVVSFIGFRTKFTGRDDRDVPSAWDSRHLMSSQPLWKGWLFTVRQANRYRRGKRFLLVRSPAPPGTKKSLPKAGFLITKLKLD